MIRVEWDITKTVAGLQALLARLRDLTPAWRNLLAYLRQVTAQTFDTQGGRIGQFWQPLSPAYAKFKAIKWPGQPILRASDRMFRSLTTEGATDSIAQVSPQALSYGTQTPYAKYHQRGTPKLPRRQFLAVTEADRIEIKRIVRAQLDNQARLSGFGG